MLIAERLAARQGMRPRGPQWAVERKGKFTIQIGKQCRVIGERNLEVTSTSNAPAPLT